MVRGEPIADCWSVNTLRPISGCTDVRRTICQGRFKDSRAGFVSKWSNPMAVSVLGDTLRTMLQAY